MVSRFRPTADFRVELRRPTRLLQPQVALRRLLGVAALQKEAEGPVVLSVRHPERPGTAVVVTVEEALHLALEPRFFGQGLSTDTSNCG